MIPIVIVSSKGGVGKTLFSINLALELSKNHKTALLDIDLDSSNEAGLFGLDSDSDINLETRKLIPKEYNGLKIFAMSIFLPRADMGVTIPEPQRRTFIIEAIKNTEWGELDFMIIDTPGGTGIELTTVHQLLPDCMVIIVSELNQTEDYIRTVDVLRHYNIKIIGVIENCTSGWMHGKPVFCSCGCGEKFSPYGEGTNKDVLPDIKFLGSIPLCGEIYKTNPPRIPEEFMTEIMENLKDRGLV